MNQRLNDIAFRWIDGCLPEIVQYKDSDGDEDALCFTLGFWEKGSDGYNFCFVANRPFDYSDTETLWKLMKYGQTICNAYFELEN